MPQLVSSAVLASTKKTSQYLSCCFKFLETAKNAILQTYNAVRDAHKKLVRSVKLIYK